MGIGIFESGLVYITDLDNNVCPIPLKTDVGQVDLVLRLSDGTSETRGSQEPVIAHLDQSSFQ